MQLHQSAPAFLAITAFLLAGDVHGAEPPNIDEAKRFFAHYVELERAYDVKLAELYADNEITEVYVAYRSNVDRKRQIRGPDYRRFLRKRILKDKAANNEFAYEDLSFVVEGRRVRIQAGRRNTQTGLVHRFNLLVGTWHGTSFVFEEVLLFKQTERRENYPELLPAFSPF